MRRKRRRRKGTEKENAMNVTLKSENHSHRFGNTDDKHDYGQDKKETFNIMYGKCITKSIL